MTRPTLPTPEQARNVTAKEAAAMVIPADAPTAPIKVTPTQRREDALVALTDKAFRADYTKPDSEAGSNREYWARQILELRSLGKTERWLRALDMWADMVGNDEYELAWAFLQYGVFAGYAA